MATQPCLVDEIACLWASPPTAHICSIFATQLPMQTIQCPSSLLLTKSSRGR